MSDEELPIEEFMKMMTSQERVTCNIRGEEVRCTFKAHLLFKESIKNVDEESILQAEKIFVERLPPGVVQRLSVGGDALKTIPVGFVCAYGSEDAVQALMEKYKPEGELCRCAKYKIPESTPTLEVLQEALIGCFPDEKLEGRTFGWGAERIEFVLEQELIPPGSFLFVLLEQWDEKGKFKITLPGGKRQLGEPSIECALREFKEETGIEMDKALINLSMTKYNHEMRANFYFTELTVF
jgi:hypothetical protein